MTPDTRIRRLYYSAALFGLRFVDQRAGQRRFGEGADARWQQLAGDLHLADRIDLLIRDADAQWPGAFGARTVFDLPEVAEDDAFGADWFGGDGPPLEDTDASDLWERVAIHPPPPDLPTLIAQLAATWDLRLTPVPLPELTPTSRWLLFTPDAVASALLAFAGARDVAWSDQVVVGARSPLALEPGTHPRAQLTRALTRQLAAMAQALLGHQLRPTAFAALEQPRQPHPAEEVIGLHTESPDHALDRAWLDRKAPA